MSAPRDRAPGGTPGSTPDPEATAEIPVVARPAPADPFPFPGVPPVWTRFAEEYRAAVAEWLAADLELRAREAHAYALARARFAAPDPSMYANGEPGPAVPWSRVEEALTVQEKARDVARAAEARMQARHRAYDAVVTQHEGRGFTG